MTQTFISRQKSQSPTTSPPVQTSRFANRPFAEPVQQKAQQPNLQTILQRSERAGNPTEKMAWGNTQPEVQRQGVTENETEESKVQTEAESDTQSQDLEEQKNTQVQTQLDSTIQQQESEQKPEEETVQQQSTPEEKQKNTEVQTQLYSTIQQQESEQLNTKRTEKKVIKTAGNSDDLTDGQRDTLSNKMNNKDQSNKLARKIAEEIEHESQALLDMIPDNGQRERVKQAIKDYVISSTAIQNDARGNIISANVQELDYALEMIRQQIRGGEKRRITYRSITYDQGVQTIPYGLNVGGNIINEGDFVGDLGFQSTSEHRQFILGKEQTAVPPAIVKQAIYSYSGIPIAIHFPRYAYSNDNKKELYDQDEAKKNKLEQAWNAVFGPGPQAGQAEVLFARDTIFKVTKIERDDANNSVAVILEEARTINRPNPVKNAKLGSPI